jgi:hypothetical protein
MNLATQAGLIAGTSVLAIAGTGTAGDLDSVIDGIINDSATISGDDHFSMSGIFAYGFAHTDSDDYNGGIGSASLSFEGEAGGWNWAFNYVLGANGAGYYAGAANELRDYGIWQEMDNGLAFGFGNMKSNFLGANSVDEANTLQINNTATGAALEGQGEQIALCYSADQFKVSMQAYDAGDAGTDFRVDFLAMGSWDNCGCFGSAAGSESTLVIGAGMSDDDRFDGNTFDVTYKMDAWAVHAAMTDVLDGGWEATTIQGSYFFADNTQAYVSYEDGEIAGVDFDDLDVGVNHYYSDSCKATLEIDFEEDGVVDGDMTIAGQVQFTF